MSDKQTAYRFEPQTAHETNQPDPYARQDYSGQDPQYQNQQGQNPYAVQGGGYYQATQQNLDPNLQSDPYSQNPYAQNIGQTYQMADGTQVFAQQDDQSAYANTHYAGQNQYTGQEQYSGQEQYAAQSNPYTGQAFSQTAYPAQEAYQSQEVYDGQQGQASYETNPYLEAHANAQTSTPIESYQQPDLYQQSGYQDQSSVYQETTQYAATNESGYGQDLNYAGTAQNPYVEPAMQTGQFEQANFEQTGFDQASYDQANYSHDGMVEQAGGPGTQLIPGAMGVQPGQHEMPQYEEDEGSGRKSFLVGTMILGAVVIGGGIAAAYKYSTPFGGQNGDGPTITSDGSSLKSLPGDAGGKVIANKNKKIYDRLGGGSNSGSSATDRISSDSTDRLQREIAARSRQPKSIEDQLRNSATTITSSDQTKSANPGSPRKVRTVTVRPDGTFVTSDGPTSAIPTDSTVNAIDGVKLDSGPSRKVRTLQATNNQVGSPQPNSISRSGPISTARAPSPRTQNNRAVSSASSSALSDGNFVVQVSSRRSQTDALATFASLKQKYPDILQGYRPLIQRADLGSKGVWYRLRIGPMASKSVASDVCSGLKKSWVGFLSRTAQIITQQIK